MVKNKIESDTQARDSAKSTASKSQTAEPPVTLPTTETLSQVLPKGYNGKILRVNLTNRSISHAGKIRERNITLNLDRYE